MRHLTLTFGVLLIINKSFCKDGSEEEIKSRFENLYSVPANKAT